MFLITISLIKLNYYLLNAISGTVNSRIAVKKINRYCSHDLQLLTVIMHYDYL